MRAGSYTDPMQSSIDAILFDLLSALLGSRSFWNRIAGSQDSGTRGWLRYLELSFRMGPYRSFEALVARAAADVGLPGSVAAEMVADWDQLEPWPEVPQVLTSLDGYQMGLVTNCSEALARRAAHRVSGCRSTNCKTR